MTFWMFKYFDEQILFSEQGLDHEFAWEDLRLFSFFGEKKQIHFLVRSDQKPVLSFGDDPEFKSFLVDKKVKEYEFKFNSYKRKESLNTRDHILGTLSGHQLIIKFRWGERDQSIKMIMTSPGKGEICLTGKAFVPGWLRYHDDFDDIFKAEVKQIWSKTSNKIEIPEEVAKYLSDRDNEASYQKNKSLYSLIIIVIIVLVTYWIFV